MGTREARGTRGKGAEGTGIPGGKGRPDGPGRLGYLEDQRDKGAGDQEDQGDQRTRGTIGGGT